MEIRKKNIIEFSSQPNQSIFQGSKLTVASSKFATKKSHLPPVKHVGSKKLLPWNSVMEVIFWNRSLFSLKKSYVYKTKHNSIWSKALSMPLTIWKFVWS